MNDEHEVDEQPTKPRGQTVKKEQPETPPALPPRQESNTVSLLDLMREAVESDAPTREERKSETDQVPSRQGSGGVPADEAPTVTSAPEPEKPARSDPARYPLAPDQLAPPDERPLVHDQDATTVQPRVAFPRGDRARQDRPIPDAPTEQYRPLRTPGQRQPPAAGPRTPGRETQPRPAAPQGTLPRQRPEPTTVIIPAQSTGRPYPRSRRQGNWQSCITRLLLIGVILVLAGAALGIAGAAIGYSIIARGLPSPTELSQRASTFETARIYDRDGNLLYSLADPTTGNRTRVSLDQISPYLIEGTIAIEDARFYDNPGFDPIGITRAVVQAAQEGEIVSGASTITQQLVRALLLDEEERTQRTFSRKVREIILAAEISRTYDKEEILELYLNEIYYGNLAYGIEAAAQTYFRKSAADLTLAEASLLAGLPQAPALWDPYTAPDKAIARQWQVLSQMVAEGYVTLEEAQAALDEANIFVYNLEPPVVTIRHPHFTFTVLQQAEERLGAQSIYRGGLRIYTTLDPRAQQLAEATVEAQRANVNAAGANNAAMVVLEPETGQILALVGSVDFNSEAISGQVNMALAPRQPGSTIKPLVYLAAMEQGWTPATLIWDVPTQFPNGTNPPYVPKNYDDEFHGPLLLRPALGNSYNIPAVKALEFVGVCNFIDYVPRLGLTSLQDEGCREVGQPRNYGLSLALGGGEISPLEMASAFAVLANQGRYAAPFAITRIDNNQGELIFEHTPTSPEGAQVIRSEHAFLLSNILSDNNARQPEFGVNNPLVIPGRQVAAKTGTSGSTVSDVRDAWTIGYTPQVVTAVWVGNTNNEPISRGQSGGLLAAPIWNSFMNQYLADKPAVDFVRPPGIVDMQICADSGTRPGPDCPNTRTEVFAQDQLPLESDRDFLQKIPIDLWTHLRANETCPESVYEATFFDLLVTGNESVLEREQAAATQWLVETAAGQNWAARRNLALPLRLPPSQSCDSGTIRPQVSISQPESGAELIDVVEIRGTALGPNFNGYVAEYGVGQDPGGWGRIQEHRPDQVDGGVLALWDTTAVNYSGPATVRVVIFGPDNPFTVENDPVTLEARVSVNLLQPTATPTTTPTETATPTATSLPTETPTSTVTPSPTATSTPAIIVTVAPTSEPTVDVDTDSTATPQSTPTP